MDDTTANLIRTLLTRVGMIMEDASVSALTLTARDPTFVARMAALAKAIDAASILLRSAAVLYAEAAREED